MSDYPFHALTGVNHGERWDDLRVGVTSINPPGGDADPTLNSTNGLLEFSATAVNTIAVEVQLPHAWAQGTTIRPHVHWRKKTEGTGNVAWQLTYEFANAGATFTDTPTTVLATAAAPVTADDGSALRHLITTWGDVDMTGKNVSCVGMLTISRLGDDEADDYAGVAQLLSVDIHYRVDSLGSAAEYIKQTTHGVQP